MICDADILQPKILPLTILNFCACSVVPRPCLRATELSSDFRGSAGGSTAKRGKLTHWGMAEKPGDGANVKVAVRCRPLNARYIHCE